MSKVVLLNGRFAGAVATLKYEPPVIVVDGLRYSRIDDPDTGESLGAYSIDFVPER